ncbi:MAG: radical SAM protein [Planctomycetota bacterium]
MNERRPATVIWEITNACDLRCLHCESAAGLREPDELSTGEALELCDALADLGCERTNLSGGEPLLRADWPLLAKRLAGRGVTVHLVTNGTHLSPDAVRQARDAGVVGIAVSLDGLRETHDRIRLPAAAGAGSPFERAVAAIRTSVGAPMKTGVITHINRWNLPELDALYALLAGIGPDVWQVQLAMPAGRLRKIAEAYLIRPDQLEEVYACLLRCLEDGRVPLRVTDNIGYYTELEPAVRGRWDEGASFWRGCQAGCSVLGIESNGNVKGCPSMSREFVAGNVRKETLSAIWADEARFAYNTRWDGSKLTGFCAGCAYRRLCRAGCTSLAFSVTGAIYENPYCLHRVRILREGGKR